MKELIPILAVLAFGSVLHAQFASELPVPGTITVQACIDGPSELHVTPEGIYWINGKNAKPGRHDGTNLATYVNGEPWFPLWHQQHQDRGVDTSFTHIIHSDSLDFDFKLISVGYTKTDAEIVPRTPVSFGMEGPEYVIHIPDPEPGAMWYKFVLTPRQGSGKKPMGSIFQ